MRSLPLYHRIQGQPVLILGDGEAAAAKRQLVARAGADILDDMQEAIDKGARLAFVALEDESAAKAAAIRLRCAGLLVNVVDRPELCDFTTPSLLERDPVLIAFGTSGASAGLAKALRLRFEALLPPKLGDLATKLSATRDAMKQRWPDGTERRKRMDNALGASGFLDPFNPGAAEKVEAWIAEDDAESGPNEHTISLRSSDPDDLTFGQARLLGSADYVIHDARVPEAILQRARADAIRFERPYQGRDLKGLVVEIRLD